MLLGHGQRCQCAANARLLVAKDSFTRARKRTAARGTHAHALEPRGGRTKRARAVADGFAFEFVLENYEHSTLVEPAHTRAHVCARVRLPGSAGVAKGPGPDRVGTGSGPKQAELTDARAARRSCPLTRISTEPTGLKKHFDRSIDEISKSRVQRGQSGIDDSIDALTRHR